MRIYLSSPRTIPDLAGFKTELARVLESGNVAAFLLDLEKPDADIVKTLMPVAHARDVAFIVAHDLDLCRACGCDGVHLGSADARVDDSRRLLGDDAIIGAMCGSSRHAAMVAAERGASYVTLSPDAGLLAWWQETMEIPCVADAGETPPANLTAADFVLLPWNLDSVAFSA